MGYVRVCTVGTPFLRDEVVSFVTLHGSYYSSREYSHSLYVVTMLSMKITGTRVITQKLSRL